MPIQKIRKKGIIYFRWGKMGKLYRSREKARLQGIAITLSKLRRKGRILPRSRAYNPAREIILGRQAQPKQWKRSSILVKPKSRRYKRKTRRKGFRRRIKKR